MFVNPHSFLRSLLCAFLLFLSAPIFAETLGRVDIGPAYVHIDMLESGHTRRKLNLYAVKGDSTILIYKGLCIKPGFLLADGDASLNTWNAGLGFYYPVNDCLSVTPGYGYSETRFKSSFDMNGMHLHERFVSRAQYLSLDVTWKFAENWRLCGIYQYAWSHVTTKITFFGTSKSNCQGPNYALVLERDLNESFSVNLGAAYNISLTKEKHGLRGAGAKIGFVYWF